MRSTVEQQGLAAFNAATVANGWQAPVIPSAWYVANVSPADQRPYYQAARELGSALLAAIDAWAPAMRNDGMEEVLAKATALIEVAYWLGASEGYANILLSGRARDVAVTGLARRAADLNVPLEPTKAELQRCHAPFDAAAVRARVLNFEAGVVLFPTGPEATSTMLADVWGKRLAKMHLRELNALPTPNPTPGSDSAQILEERQYLAAMGVTPGPPEPSDVFFTDDEVRPPFTTRTLWDKKQHEQLLGSPVPQNLDSVEILIQFRETIGYFPLQPAERRESIASPGEEAFADAWRPHIGTATFNLGRGAWQTYDAVQKGHLLDDDTVATLGELSRTPGALATLTAAAVTNTPTSGPTDAPASGAATPTR